ncbi:MAG TPA: hypothetical protein VIG63_03035, partial [Savagea sp.]
MPSESMSKMFVGINKKSITQLISVPIGRFLTFSQVFLRARPQPLSIEGQTIQILYTNEVFVDWRAERRLGW